jgi:hypothetical protein
MVSAAIGSFFLPLLELLTALLEDVRLLLEDAAVAAAAAAAASSASATGVVLPSRDRLEGRASEAAEDGEAGSLEGLEEGTAAEEDDAEGVMVVDLRERVKVLEDEEEAPTESDFALLLAEAAEVAVAVLVAAPVPLLIFLAVFCSACARSLVKSFEMDCRWNRICRHRAAWVLLECMEQR